MTTATAEPPTQASLIPAQPPTLTPITTFIYDFRIGPHPPLDAAFIESVRRYGVMQPPVVRLRPNLGYDVIEGRRRAAALKVLHNEGAIPFNMQVPAMLLEGDASDEVLALMLNEQRSSNPVSDLAAIERLVASGADIKEICAATGLGKGTVEKRMRLKALAPLWRDAFDTGQLSVSTAEALARLSIEQQGDLYKVYTTNGNKITLPEIRAVRRVQSRAAVDALPEELFAMDAVSDWAGDPADIQTGIGGWYRMAAGTIERLIASAPANMQAVAHDNLTFLSRFFADLAASQSAGFLAEGEQVDLSDVIPTDDTPYDEEYDEDDAVDVPPAAPPTGGE